MAVDIQPVDVTVRRDMVGESPVLFVAVPVLIFQPKSYLLPTPSGATSRRDISTQDRTRFPPPGGLMPVDQPVTFGVQRTAANTVQLDFARILRTFAPTLLPVRYSITGPSVITVTGVAFTGGTATVVLTVSGVWVGGTYTVTVANETAQAYSTDDYNSTAGVSLPILSGAPSGANFNTGFN